MTVWNKTVLFNLLVSSIYIINKKVEKLLSTYAQDQGVAALSTLH
jgi:hypothetical protein